MTSQRQTARCTFLVRRAPSAVPGSVKHALTFIVALVSLNNRSVFNLWTSTVTSMRLIGVYDWSVEQACPWRAALHVRQWSLQPIVMTHLGCTEYVQQQPASPAEPACDRERLSLGTFRV